MQTLRVANVGHVCALPYRSLAQYEFIKYEENPAMENGRKLHEGEVDLALISAAEFANHGGYVGLDFGVGCRERSDTMVLYAEKRLEEISQIHIYESASSSAVLLRVLLAGLWKVNPALVRRSEQGIIESVRGDHAALVLHEVPLPAYKRFPIAEDLVSAWCKWTGKPYVSLVWAMRPGALRADHLQFCNDIFHRSVKARAALASAYAHEFGVSPEICVDHVTRVREYYLDQTMLNGLDEVFARAESLGLTPPARYRNATLTLLERKIPGRQTEPSVKEVLARVDAGARLGIREGVRLAYEASLAELGAVAESIRKRARERRQVQFVYEIDEPPTALGSSGAIDNVLNQVESAVAKGIGRIRLPILARFTADLSQWEKVLVEVKRRFGVAVEGCSVFELRWISALCRSPLQDVVRRLVTSGLDYVSGDGGEMLVERVNTDSSSGFLTVADWLETMRWVHHFGGRSHAILRLRHHESWEDRLLHLHKLRSLQDETPGFASLSVRVDSEWRRPSRVDAKMRATMLARLFMDNIASLQETEVLASGVEVTSLLGAASGCDIVRIVVDGRLDAPRELLSGLATVGLELEEESFEPVPGNKLRAS